MNDRKRPDAASPEEGPLIPNEPSNDEIRQHFERLPMGAHLVERQMVGVLLDRLAAHTEEDGWQTHDEAEGEKSSRHASRLCLGNKDSLATVLPRMVAHPQTPRP